MIEGDGISGLFWDDSRQAERSPAQTGAQPGALTRANFFHRIAHSARVEDDIAGMLLVYRLPAGPDNIEVPQDLTDFVGLQIKLEQCVSAGFYNNMPATYSVQGQLSGIQNAGSNRVSLLPQARSSCIWERFFTRRRSTPSKCVR